MRVIAGSARHLNLKTVPGMDVRPTTDKTKETLFNVLNADVPYSRFLDLFSGSGAIISSDLHHPFENIIGYSQMFELGQKAFSQYIPVSGMYSVIHGFFLKLFGHGYAGYYHLSTNIFYC